LDPNLQSAQVAIPARERPLGQTPGARPISTPSLSFLFSEQLARGTQSPSGLLLPREDSAVRTNLTGSPGSALTLGLMEASSPFSRDKSWESATASTISAGELLQIERICFLLRAMTSAHFKLRSNGANPSGPLASLTLHRAVNASWAIRRYRSSPTSTDSVATPPVRTFFTRTDSAS
jgi:hypothetical protein